MASNPFRIDAWPNRTLPLELEQRICYAALRVLVSGRDDHEVPPSWSADVLRQRAAVFGPDTYVLHPNNVETIFAGVTFAVYQTIAALYCERLGRSVSMVWHIIAMMASHAVMPSISYEATWAICMYLRERRTEQTGVTIQRDDAAWYLMHVRPDVLVQDGAQAPYQPTIICVIDNHEHIITCQLNTRTHTHDQALLLSVYHAIVSQRRPSAEGIAGLEWSLPAHLIMEQAASQRVKATCASVNIVVKHQKNHMLDVSDLRGAWATSLAGRVLPPNHLLMFFDKYIYRTRGYSPLIARADCDYAYRDAIGYNRDPVWQFPALHAFLPGHEGTIGEDGAVAFDGLHYEHELLRYWPQHTVTLSRSVHAESTAWVCLDGEIVCQAMARELRRKDGSYRSSR